MSPSEIGMVHPILWLVVKGACLDARTTLEYLSDIVILSNDVCVLAIATRSLLEILANMAHDDSVVALVYQAMKKIIRRVSGPNEDTVTTGEEWLQAEAGGTLPEVVDGVNLSQPIAKVFFDKATLLPEHHQLPYVMQILEPIMDVSAVANDRWLRVFLRKESPTTPFPSCFEPRPFHTYMVLTLLENWLPYIHARYAQHEHHLALNPVAAKEVEESTQSIANSMSTNDPRLNLEKYWFEVL